MSIHQGDYLTTLSFYRNAVSIAIEQSSPTDLARAYYHIAMCLPGLGDFVGERNYFAKSAKLWRNTRHAVNAARAMRCIVRALIRLHGRTAVADMEVARNEFLALGLAGEACRTIIATMQELYRRDPTTD